MDRILVEEYKPFVKNTLQGFAVLRLPSGMILHSVCLHKKNDRYWVSPPARPYKLGDDAQGATMAWEPMVTFIDRATSDRFQEAAVSALLAHIRANGGAA